MTAAAASALGGANIAAFLDMLAVSEGTDIPSQRSNDRQSASLGTRHPAGHAFSASSRR